MNFIIIILGIVLIIIAIWLQFYIKVKIISLNVLANVSQKPSISLSESKKEPAKPEDKFLEEEITPPPEMAPPEGAPPEEEPPEMPPPAPAEEAAPEAPMPAACATCGAQIPEGSPTCPACGAPAPPPPAPPEMVPPEGAPPEGMPPAEGMPPEMPAEGMPPEAPPPEGAPPEMPPPEGAPPEMPPPEGAPPEAPPPAEAPPLTAPEGAPPEMSPTEIPLKPFSYLDRPIYEIKEKTVEKPVFIKYKGEAILTKRVYVNESHNFIIKLKSVVDKKIKDDEQLIVKDIEKGKLLTVIIKKDKKQLQYLEIELKCGALKIDGENKQRKSLTTKELFYCWNGKFTRSGNHEIAFIFKVLTSTKHFDLNGFGHKIRVNHVDHLTYHQVKFFSYIGVSIGSLIGILGGLKEIGLF